MKELSYFRPSYVIRDATGASGDEFADAHRVVRTAIAVGEILDVPFEIVDSAASVVERVENAGTDDRVLAVDEVSRLAALITSVEQALGEAVDDQQRLQGAGGERIHREATQPVQLGSGEPDFDRVFELVADGRVGLLHPRMSLYELREALPALGRFLRDAVAIKSEVALVE